MLSSLIQQQVKSFFRSAIWQKNAFINFLLVLLFAYLAFNFIAIGYFAGDIIMGVFPNESPITRLNSWLLYYFLFDLVLRFFIQPLPVMGVQPYLHLPIKKAKLIHFQLVRSGFNFYNISILFFALPFSLKFIAKYESVSGAWLWLLGLLLTSFTINNLTGFIKKVLGEKPLVVLGFAVLLLMALGLEYYNYIHLTKISVYVFDGLITKPVLIVIPIALFTATYLNTFWFYKSRLYIEDLTSSNKRKFVSGNIKFLENLQTVGKLIELELKLIWRNKRPKSVTIMSFLFFFYGFIFYPTSTNSYGLILVGLFVTGMFLLNYGQFMLSWESHYFDAILAKNIQINEFLRAKFLLFGAASLLGLFASLIYFKFGYKVVYTNLAMAIFNMGVNFWIMVFFATMGPKKIDLSKGTFFNYEGVGAQQFILIIPVMGLPMIIFAVFHLMFSEIIGLTAILICGLLALLCTKPLLNMFSNRIIEKKYEIAQNFRAS